MSNILAVIPARSQSKGIIDKNIRLFNGKPLLAYSIKHALSSNKINRVIVSTDSEKYAEIAKEFGAEVPFLRPNAIAQDDSLDIDVFTHALNYLRKEENYLPEMCVHLRPTHPLRHISDIDTAVQILLDNPQFDSVRSVSPTKQTPYKMWTIDQEGRLAPIATCHIPEAYNAPRQMLPQVWTQNANLDIVRSWVILGKHSMTGTNIAAFKQDFDFDIDSESEFIRAELFLELFEKLQQNKKLIINFDIDGIIANKTIDNQYANAAPRVVVINIVNYLYDAGHHIILFTARGSATGIDWSEVTRHQLDRWGVKYHELKFGKIAADIYIDDRLLTIGELQWLTNSTI